MRGHVSSRHSSSVCMSARFLAAVSLAESEFRVRISAESIRGGDRECQWKRASLMVRCLSHNASKRDERLLRECAESALKFLHSASSRQLPKWSSHISRYSSISSVIGSAGVIVERCGSSDAKCAIIFCSLATKNAPPIAHVQTLYLCRVIQNRSGLRKAIGSAREWIKC